MFGMPALAANTDEAKQKTPTDQRTQIGELVDDAWITTKVKAMLLKADALSAPKIDVDTKDRVVRLSGQVENSKQVAQAQAGPAALKAGHFQIFVLIAALLVTGLTGCQ